MNYARLMVFFKPEGIESGKVLNLKAGDESELVITVLEHYRYTSLLDAEYLPATKLPWLKRRKFKINAAHDLRLLEVVETQKRFHLLGKYGYPNKQMLQPDEKFQTNMFLGDLLKNITSCRLHTNCLQ